MVRRAPTHASAVSTAGHDATLVVNAPSSVRGGLLYTASFTVRARAALKNATLVLDPGWIDGMQINSTTPQPVNEASRGGSVVLELGHVPAGPLTGNLAGIDFTHSRVVSRRAIR